MTDFCNTIDARAQAAGRWPSSTRGVTFLPAACSRLCVTADPFRGCGRAFRRRAARGASEDASRAGRPDRAKVRCRSTESPPRPGRAPLCRACARTGRRPYPFEAHAPDALPTGGTTPFRPADFMAPREGCRAFTKAEVRSAVLAFAKARGLLRTPATEPPVYATADLRREAEPLRPGEPAPLGPTRCAQRDAPSTSSAARSFAASEGGLCPFDHVVESQRPRRFL